MIEPARIHVRYADLDVLGHVNNSIYLSYFEVARVHYFGVLLGTDWDWNTNGVILVTNNVEYHKPVLLNDAPFVKMTVEEIGTKSFKLSYELSVNNEVYTTGGSTLVCFDNAKGETISIPDVMKDILLQLKA